LEALLTKARKYLPEDKIELITEAFHFADGAHHGQMRLSGEPFIEHPIQTAVYLADLHLDSYTLAAALLHDVMEDCNVEFAELESRFGTEVAKLVEGVTKLTRSEIPVNDRSPGQLMTSEHELARAETLQKMLMSMAEDVRVVLIKLADRLHNMRTLKAQPPDRRIAIARETLDIYAPLAHRLGIWEMKWRLEDLSFRYLDPASYTQTSKLLKATRTEREEYIERVRDVLQTELDAAGIKAKVTGRPKNIYSVFKKIQNYASHNREISDIYDFFALRVLVDKIQDCYAALGIVHTNWHPLPGQFDDYIANPKDNLYQSLHTTVLCEDASPVEVQIRTREMHQAAEYGVAAHWLYKANSDIDLQFEEKMTWLRQLLDWQREVSGAEEFVESFKSDIFKNQVFVYTPMGELKELPAGSTVVDFAYRVHTDIGDRCIGAKVNGKLVPLHSQLQNGDTVQIMTSQTVSGPSPEWLNPELGYVNTSSARAKIRQWFNRQERKTNIKRGRELFQRQVRRLHRTVEDQEVALLMGCETVDEFFAALGNGEFTISQVAARLSFHEMAPEQEVAITIPSIGPGSGLNVVGAGDLLTSMAHCCHPIHGDEIVGVVTRSRGVTVHRKSCPSIDSEAESEHIVQVNWGETQTLYPIRIRVEAWDRVGLLRDLTSLVSGERVNIASVITEEEEEVSVVTLTVYITGIDQLNRLFSRLESVDGVTGVTRAEPELAQVDRSAQSNQEV
jgi:GTP pyrophosphokinase